MTFSTFESCLIRYHVIGQRLVYSDFVLDRLAPRLNPLNIRTIFTENEKKEAEKLNQELWEYSLSSRICFDFNVVQLFSLLEAHDDMLSHLTTTERKKLESFLSEAWGVVEQQKTRICKWRNNHTAHGKSFAKDGSFIMIPDVDPDYFQGQIDLFKASKCAIIYIDGFLKNIPEYKKIILNYNSKSTKIKTMSSQPYLQIDVDPLLEKIKQNLKNNGLNSVLKTKLEFNSP